MAIKKMKSAPVGVIDKVLVILELLDRNPGGLKLKEIAEQSGINKSTAHRFLSHLETRSYLFRDNSGTYMIGPKLTKLGTGVSSHVTLAKMCRGVLENLRAVTGETVNLAVLDGFDVLYVDVLETGHTFRLVSEIGMRRPFYCTSLGKAILANIKDEHTHEELVASIRFDPVTPRTITNLARLKKQLALILKRGFALDDEEAVAGIRCLGAAIFGADGEVVGAISVSGPVVRVTTARLPLFSQEICRAAREITWLLGNNSIKPSKAL
ncbi:MAG: IclR family transcriptional regulator [Acidobacteriota bacterium]